MAVFPKTSVDVNGEAKSHTNSNEKDTASGLEQCQLAAVRSIGEGHLAVTHEFDSGPQLKTQFGGLATLGVAFSILNSWIGAAGSLIGPVSLGGYVTVIWGCLAAAVFTTILSVGVAEMASAMPAAGGPYHYTFMLAQERNRKFLSFFVGWCNMIAWWFMISSGLLFMATFFTGMAVLYHEDFVPTTWQVYLVFILILVLGTAFVIGGNTIMSHFTSLSFYCCMIVFIICITVPLAMHRGQPYQDASTVFTNVSNLSGWDSNGTAFVIGWMLSCYNFIGIDAVTHLSEEMQNPALRVPQAMLGALATGCVTSVCFLVAMLFCVTDIDAVIQSPTGVPILAIFYQATNNKAISVFLLTMVCLCLVFSVVSGILICGRTTWAFARDNGLPFSEYFSQIDSRSKMPVRATLLSSSLSVLYGAIYVGSSVAFQSIVGSTIIMLFVTYSMPQGVLAVRGRHHLPPRPFNLGRIGRLCNILAALLACFLTVVICLPLTLPVTPQNMNYLSVIVAGCSVLIVAFWFLAKKGVYHGPVVVE